MHLNSELLFRKYAMDYVKSGFRVLEVGPSSIPTSYQGVVANTEIVWHTLDLYSSYKGITYVSHEEYKYPVDPESYDVIISGQVIEHVKKIWLWIEELNRILKKGGILIIINPVSWPFHEYPVDCWRIFPDGMKALCDEYNLEVLVCKCESIEAGHLRDLRTPTIPGSSYALENQKTRLKAVVAWNTVLYYIPLVRKFRVPLEVAYDTITVARKKLQ